MKLVNEVDSVIKHLGYTRCADNMWRKRVNYPDGTHEILVRDESGRLRVDRVSNWPHSAPVRFLDN